MVKSVSTNKFQDLNYEKKKGYNKKKNTMHDDFVIFFRTKLKSLPALSGFPPDKTSTSGKEFGSVEIPIITCLYMYVCIVVLLYMYHVCTIITPSFFSFTK